MTEYLSDSRIRNQGLLLQELYSYFGMLFNMYSLRVDCVSECISYPFLLVYCALCRPLLPCRFHKHTAERGPCGPRIATRILPMKRTDAPSFPSPHTSLSPAFTYKHIYTFAATQARQGEAPPHDEIFTATVTGPEKGPGECHLEERRVLRGWTAESKSLEHSWGSLAGAKKGQHQKSDLKYKKESIITLPNEAFSNMANVTGSWQHALRLILSERAPPRGRDEKPPHPSVLFSETAK